VGDLLCREIKPGKAIIGLFSHRGERQSGRIKKPSSSYWASSL
jgi:hypothetical protein